jgi:hypothetical protein
MRKYVQSWKVASAMAVALSTLTLVGCGASDDLPREGVTGTVTLNDKPLASGFITFMPAGAEATQGGSVIQEGSYSIPSDQGLVPGTYKVLITSTGGGSATQTDHVTDMPGMPPIPAKEAIPAEYNAKSTLTAEVKAGGENVFDFPLKGSPRTK